MIDAVLDERLQDQLDRCVPEQSLIQVVMHMKLVPEPDLLDRDIIPHKIDFLLQQNDALPFIQRHSVILGQIIDHLVHLHSPFFDRKGRDGGQGVVQKMGIDLGLERIQLRLLPCDLLHVHVMDQGLYGRGHLIERKGHLADLVMPHRLNRQPEIPALHLPDLCDTSMRLVMTFVVK